MKTNVTGRKLSLRPSFVEKTEKKLSKLDKFFEDDARADVTVKQEGNGFKVETTIHNQGMVYRAEEAAPDMVEALDKLVRQIRKNKTRLEKRLREEAFAVPPPPEEEEMEEEYAVVRSKSFPVKPLDVEEAILQMNLLGHQFYMFRNGETGEINVVYRRRDGHYGLLEPNAD